MSALMNPSSSLDYDSMLRVSETIETLADDGAIIIFVVSHGCEFIARTLLKSCCLIKDAVPKDTYDQGKSCGYWQVNNILTDIGAVICQKNSGSDSLNPFQSIYKQT